MKDLSIIFPVKDETKELVNKTLEPLLADMTGKDTEIIIIDNSKYEKHEFTHPQIRHVKNGKNVGVGLSFNQGVELADSERIVLMGCDILVQEGWYDRVIQTLDSHKNTIFNARMSGCTDTQEPFRTPRAIRHGAHILYKMTVNDLPKHSLLKNDKKFSRILQAKWNTREPNPGEEFGEIGCLLGAFYWMHKTDYQKIHGFNHHKMWGSLEPLLSIKARGHGITLLVDKRLEVSHRFSRSVVRPSRPDYQYFNMLLIGKTCFSDALYKEFENHLRYGGREEKIEKLNVNRARVMLKRVHGAIQEERDYNDRHFTNGLIKNIKNFENHGKDRP